MRPACRVSPAPDRRALLVALHAPGLTTTRHCLAHAAHVRGFFTGQGNPTYRCGRLKSAIVCAALARRRSRRRSLRLPANGRGLPTQRWAPSRTAPAVLAPSSSFSDVWRAPCLRLRRPATCPQQHTGGASGLRGVCCSRAREQGNTAPTPIPPAASCRASVAGCACVLFASCQRGVFVVCRRRLYLVTPSVLHALFHTRAAFKTGPSVFQIIYTHIFCCARPRSSSSPGTKRGTWIPARTLQDPTWRQL